MRSCPHNNTQPPGRSTSGIVCGKPVRVPCIQIPGTTSTNMHMSAVDTVERRVLARLLPGAQY
eukprot:4482886-Prymnesium_polylepis.1